MNAFSLGLGGKLTFDDLLCSFYGTARYLLMHCARIRSPTSSICPCLEDELEIATVCTWIGRPPG